MKKYLIALPLVLIMILSMVPVMAAPKNVNVPISYYKTPDQKELIKSEDRALLIDDALMTDAKALKAEVEKQVKALGFPKLNVEEQPAWNVEAKVTAQSQAPSTYTVESVPTPGIKVVELKKWAEDNKLEFTIDLTDSQLAARPYATGKLMTAVNDGVQALAEGKKADPIVAGYEDVQETITDDPTYALAKLVETVGDITPAKISVVAFPNCFVKEDKEDTFCPELCKEIIVRVVNAFTGKEIADAGRRYPVNPKQLPTFDGIYTHYVNTFMPRGYQILKEWNLRNKVTFPSALDKNCTITIYVLPLEVKVDVYHVLRDCCIEIDGTVNYTIWKVFEEKDQTVPFIEYHTDLVINRNRAKDYALTRLQKINATDFVFFDAFFDDGVRLDNYMTGDVYDLNGNKVMEIKNVNPRITILYNRADCQQDEEQVDNATVENNTNTQAPVTASGTQLPATGAKDVTAFFLSAVALLGLGIFFAKKH